METVKAWVRSLVVAAGLGAAGLQAHGAPAAFEVLHSMQVSDGSYPASTLLRAADGNFYGTTGSGGCADGCFGTVFRMTPQGAFEVLHTFTDEASGRVPNATLALAPDGAIYGTTQRGGIAGACEGAGCGTVFRLSRKHGFKLVHSFTEAEGGIPMAGPTVGPDGALYGTTTTNGQGSLGTVFRVTGPGMLQVVHSFQYEEGQYSQHPLVKADDGLLYGTLSLGGPRGYGSVFRFSPAGDFSVAFAFSDDEYGGHPGGLVQGPGPYLYGAATNGGMRDEQHCPFGCGILFRLGFDRTLLVVHTFLGTDGKNVMSPLTVAGGALYGTAMTGGSGPCEFPFAGCGLVFRVRERGWFDILHTFTNQPDDHGGVYPMGGVTVAPHNTLYGTTLQGGESGLGAIYRLSP